MAMAVSRRTNESSDFFKHGAGDLGHVRNVDPGLERPHGRQAQRSGDVHRVIADALEIVVDLERRHEEPEIHGHGLLKGRRWIANSSLRAPSGR
jgi:hypothetical protein